MQGHTGKVLCCCIVRGKVVSGGEDKFVMVWDLKTGKNVAQMRQHTAAVLCMTTDGHRYVYTGGADYELCKWSIDALQCEVRERILSLGQCCDESAAEGVHCDCISFCEEPL